MIKRRGIRNNKKGISEMVGYVILITIGVLMGLLVYQWLKTYVPKEAIECPDGTSVAVQEPACNGNQLSLVVKNNGVFKVDGYYIYGTLDPDEKVATENIATLRDPQTDHVDFGNSLNPGEVTDDQIFTLENSVNLQSVHIYSIEIMPMRIQPDSKGVNTFVQCTEAKISEEIECG